MPQSDFNRRGLFGLLAGAAVAPLIKAAAPIAPLVAEPTSPLAGGMSQSIVYTVTYKMTEMPAVVRGFSTDYAKAV